MKIQQMYLFQTLQDRSLSYYKQTQSARLKPGSRAGPSPGLRPGPLNGPIPRPIP